MLTFWRKTAFRGVLENNWERISNHLYCIRDQILFVTPGCYNWILSYFLIKISRKFLFSYSVCMVKTSWNQEMFFSQPGTTKYSLYLSLNHLVRLVETVHNQIHHQSVHTQNPCWLFKELRMTQVDVEQKYLHHEGSDVELITVSGTK